MAGCLLMPGGDFADRFNHFWALQSRCVSNDLTVLRYVVRQLIFDFCVSWHAVAIRARQLYLIDQEQLDELIELFNSNSP